MQIESIFVKGGVFIFLSICAVWDIRKKEIPLVPALISLMAAAGVNLWRIRNESLSVLQVLGSLLPGIFFLTAGWCTKEKVGYGDGLLLLITGLMVGFYRCFSGLCIGLFLSAIFSAFLMLLHRAEKNSRIPFVPFLTIGMGVCFII